MSEALVKVFVFALALLAGLLLGGGIACWFATIWATDPRTGHLLASTTMLAIFLGLIFAGAACALHSWELSDD